MRQVMATILAYRQFVAMLLSVVTTFRGNGLLSGYAANHGNATERVKLLEIIGLVIDLHTINLYHYGNTTFDVVKYLNFLNTPLYSTEYIFLRFSRKS